MGMSDQEKLEKAINGLECCFPMTTRNGFADCKQCPYDRKITLEGWVTECCHDLMADALALLKAQEARVLTLEEVRALQDDAVVWLEDNDKTDAIAGIVNHVWNSLPYIVSFTVKGKLEVKADILWYGFKWRCWTSRPTETEREATPRE